MSSSVKGLAKLLWWNLYLLATIQAARSHDMAHPFSRIEITNTVSVKHITARIDAVPSTLGLTGQSSDWVTVKYSSSSPANDDWIGVFSPSNFSSLSCQRENTKEYPPLLCTAPIKFQYANYSTPGYNSTGHGTLKLLVINQRLDYSFALFSGGFQNPKLVAVSNRIAFHNPKAPVFPRLSQGKKWNEMAITWTSGYGVKEALPFVEWGLQDKTTIRSPAETLTFDRNSMCGPPARTVGWRDPGFFHTSFLNNLLPNMKYNYRLGHKLIHNKIVWSKWYKFRSSPFPGQNSLQRVIIFGDMGKTEADGSSEYNNYQPGSLLVTNRLVEDLNEYDIVFLIGDISYANGYLAQWDQFTAQVEPIASTVPMMIASGNHEQDWPGSGSFYETEDSGGECGVVAETMFYVPAENRTNFWYSTDYGMFRFCIANTELDWREGSEQYKFIEHCLQSVDRKKQPWLIFLAHRVLGYTSTNFYSLQGTPAEPMGRESLQKLWQNYKVDIALFGHVHNYERTCPVYESVCTHPGMNHYKGQLNGTIHVNIGGGGAALTEFSKNQNTWSFYKDLDFGLVKLTAFNHSYMILEYVRATDGKVNDFFSLSKDH